MRIYSFLNKLAAALPVVSALFLLWVALMNYVEKGEIMSDFISISGLFLAPSAIRYVSKKIETDNRSKAVEVRF